MNHEEFKMGGGGIIEASECIWRTKRDEIDKAGTGKTVGDLMLHFVL